MTALSKDTKQRFGSVKAFANALEQAAGPIERSTPLRDIAQPVPVEQQVRLTPMPPVPPPPTPVLPVQGRGEQVTQFESVQPVQSKPLPQSEPVRMANAGTAPTQFSTTSEPGIANRPAQSPPGLLITPRPQQPARSISIWQLNRSRLIATLIGAVLYAVATFILDRWTLQSSTIFNPIANIAFLPSIGSLLFGLILIIPFFFGATFGPWAGMLAALAGGLVGDALTGSLIGWYWYAGSLLPGLFAGIALGRTQGNYGLQAARMTVLRWCLAACLLFAIVVALGNVFIDHVSTTSFFQILSVLAISNLISLIPLPFALTRFSRSRRNR